jgi:N-methylhydantoinase B
LERDPQAVLGDVLDGYVSLQGACDDYGVVIHETTLTVDLNTTEKLRESRRGQQ